MLAGEIATCSMVVMELLWTARNPTEFAELREDLEALPQLPVTPEAWQRAIDVWHELVRQGKHRQTKPADLLIAAVAELAGVGLCHYDKRLRGDRARDRPTDTADCADRQPLLRQHCDRHPGSGDSTLAQSWTFRR